jgi:hypothetical protein
LFFSAQPVAAATAAAAIACAAPTFMHQLLPQHDLAANSVAGSSTKDKEVSLG